MHQFVNKYNIDSNFIFKLERNLKIVVPQDTTPPNPEQRRPHTRGGGDLRNPKDGAATQPSQERH